MSQPHPPTPRPACCPPVHASCKSKGALPRRSCASRRVASRPFIIWGVVGVNLPDRQLGYLRSRALICPSTLSGPSWSVHATANGYITQRGGTLNSLFLSPLVKHNATEALILSGLPCLGGLFLCGTVITRRRRSQRVSRHPDSSNRRKA